MAKGTKVIKITKSTYDSKGALLPEGSEFDVPDQVSAEDAATIIKAKKAKKIA